MAVINNFAMYKGEDILLNISVYAATSTSTRLDPTGYTTVFNVKKNLPDASSIFSVVGVVTSCYVAVTIASCQTSALTIDPPSQEYAHDFWRTDAGSVACLSIGNVYIYPSVRLP